jgi:GntR family uxuAB operon transcriptional repressor
MGRSGWGTTRTRAMTASRSPRTSQPRAFNEELARRILERCTDPDYAPAGRLPTERSLADAFGVTRTMVRHALSLLEAQGQISREVGRGTFLRPEVPTVAGASARGADRARLAEFSPADVMVARRLIEPQVLPLVVAWATRRDFDELQRCLDGGAAAQSAEEFEQWDFALHHALVAAGRNPLLLAMYGMIEQARRGEIWGNLKRRNDSRERRSLYQSEHVELVGALQARETDHAVRVMETHLDRVQANLLESARQRSGEPSAP